MNPSNLQHTLNHINCPACEAERLDLNRQSDMRYLKFSAAAELILEDEQKYLLEENADLVHDTDSVHVGARTYSDHVDFVRRLNCFFGEIPLNKIHEGHWRSYQKMRRDPKGFLSDLQSIQPPPNPEIVQKFCELLGKWEGAGSTLINHETSFLSRVLDRAGLWKDLKNKCPRLQETKSSAGRAMTPEQEQTITFTASTRPRWKPFYLGWLLMLNTSRPQGEILFLRIKDMDIDHRILHFREGRGKFRLQPDGSFRRAMKTAAREKDLPMTDSVFWVCRELLKRYRRICRRLKIEPSPDHYIFPGRARGSQLDPTRPMRSFRKAWAGICAVIGLQARGIDITRDIELLIQEWAQIKKQEEIKDLRIEDVRHTVNTKMEELQADQTVSAAVREHIMGHETGTRVNVDYRHPRYKPVLEALQQIEVKPVEPVDKVDKVVEFQRSQAVARGKKSS